MTVNVVSAIVYLFNIGSRSMSNYCVVSICFLDLVGDTLFIDHPSWYVHHAHSMYVCGCLENYPTFMAGSHPILETILYTVEENHPVNMTFGNGNLFDHTYIGINLFNTNLTDKLEISLCLIWDRGTTWFNLVILGKFCERLYRDGMANIESPQCKTCIWERRIPNQK